MLKTGLLTIYLGLLGVGAFPATLEAFEGTRGVLSPAANAAPETDWTMTLYSNRTVHCINTSERPNPPLRIVKGDKSGCIKLNGDEAWWDYDGGSHGSAKVRLHTKNANITDVGNTCPGSRTGAYTAGRQCRETGNATFRKEDQYYLSVDLLTDNPN